MTVTLVEQLAAFAADVRPSTMPPDVRDGIGRRVLDLLGVAIAAVPLDTSQAVLDMVSEHGGSPQAHVIGITERVPAAQAAFANGVLAHSLDYDDTHLPSILHPSASVIPAVLAAAERTGRTGADVIAAVAVGLEVTVRLGMAGYDRAMGNSAFFERGQHATSICGAIGSAAASATMLGLDASGISHAMGLAVSMSGGVLEANRTGGTVKRMHCGWAAHAGVIAADLAARGFTGPPTVLEGRFGFFEAYLSGSYSAEALTDGLGEKWAVRDIHVKPYPANHFTHAGIDAALALRAAGLRPTDIESINLGVAAPTVRTIGEPLYDKQHPRSGYHAKFSGPYTLAAALWGGSGLGVGHDDFTDVLATLPERVALMERVTVAADERCTARYPDCLPAVVTVRTRDGSELVQEIWENRGGPHRALSDDELSAKFADNAGRVLPEDAVDEVRRAALGLLDLMDISALLVPTAKEQN